MIQSLYEPFKHWSDGGSVYILSDLHFDAADCKLMDSDWVTPEEQVGIINRVLMKGDTFVCLGDVGNAKYIPQINAKKKILILGNHDAKGAYKKYFDEIYAGPVLISDKILLSYEPVYGSDRCLNIHGHDHNNAENYKEGCKHNKTVSSEIRRVIYKNMHNKEKLVDRYIDLTKDDAKNIYQAVQREFPIFFYLKQIEKIKMEIQKFKIH